MTNTQPFTRETATSNAGLIARDTINNSTPANPNHFNRFTTAKAEAFEIYRLSGYSLQESKDLAGILVDIIREGPMA